MPLRDEKEAFINCTKLMLKENISTNAITLTSYREKIILAYNKLNKYCLDKYNTFTEESNRKTLVETHLDAKKRFILCLEKLDCTYILTEDLFATVEDVNISDINQSGKLTILNDKEPANNETILTSNSTQTPNVNMAEEMRNFLLLAKTIVNTDYKGEPLELEAFINKIKMLDAYATAGQKEIMLAFIKTKLVGKALEAIKTTDDNITKLIESLKERIKPETADVVQGKFTALRLANKTVQEFSKQAEELAEGFKRALIFEGFPEPKAHEMTIKKTVEVCREAARSDVVKSVLAASQFSNPQDVVAKFITELDKNKVERQVLSVRHFQSGRGQQYARGRGRNTSFRGHNQRFHQQNTSRFPPRNFEHNDQYNRNNRGNSHRGHSRNNYQRQSNANQSNGRQSNVRAITSGSENLPTPQSRLGETESSRQF